MSESLNNEDTSPKIPIELENLRDSEEVKEAQIPELELDNEVYLKLGDVIFITDPKNDILNNGTFYIEYIDPVKVKLVNVDNFERTQISIQSDGTLGDGTITNIRIISRNPDEGYALQNGLVPGTWVNLYFGGDVPTVFTAEIIDLDRDMIELKTVEGDTLYIDFQYQGIPEDLPIESIDVRPAPNMPSKDVEEGEEGEKVDDYVSSDNLVELGEEMLPEEQQPVAIQKKVIKEHIQQMLIEADQIQFGDSIVVQEQVNVSKENYRYNIESQTNDLLEELLAEIPDSKRTNNTLNNIHIIITRFMQLREVSSTFDENKNITGVVKKSSDDKPLADYLASFRNNLYWILFVATNVKKVYLPQNPIDSADRVNDSYVLLSASEDAKQISELFTNYKTNRIADGPNKYRELYSAINILETPFEDIDPDENNDVFHKPDGVIIEARVKDNVNAVLDTLGQLYSTIVSKNDITNKRFVIQRYNLGLDCLHANSFKGSKLVAHRVKLTNNDTMSLKAILTLPEPTIRFSQVNLPGTSILKKATLSLHYLNYWQLLKEKTFSENVEINDLDTEIDYDDSNFVDTIKNYSLNLTEMKTVDGIKPEQIYKQFLDIIIPKIRVLFNLVKKYIKGKLSLVDMITYLEPFMIYSSNLTYMNYKDIKEYIEQKIRQYNSNFIENGRAFSILKNMRYVNQYSNPILKLLDRDIPLMNKIFGLYGFSDVQASMNKISASEFIRKTTMDDYGNLFNTAVAFSNLALMYPTELNSIFEADKDSMKQKMEQDKLQNQCTNYVIAKKYNSLAELSADNSKDAYFDKEYDNTDYDLIDITYQKERQTLSPDELLLFLSDELQKKYKKDTSTSEQLAETLVNHVKKVRNGHYAIVENRSKGDAVVDLQYYVRQNNEWVLAQEIDPSWFIKDTDILCNIQTDCLYVPINKTEGTCDSLAVSKDTIVSSAIKQVLDQFDKNYQISKEALTQELNKYLTYYEDIFNSILRIKRTAFYKYNNQKYDLGLTVTKELLSKAISPYARLRDLILGQEDFVKIQQDILRFVDLYCRSGDPNRPNINDEDMESEWWLYCKETNTRLLPQFRNILARAFIMNRKEYDNILAELVKLIGKQSDSGDSWVDIHSGEVIVYIDFDVSEGYKDGFIDKSRDILEQDANNTTQAATIKDVKKRLLSKEGQLVANVILALAENMGIQIDNCFDFMIKVVTELMNDIKVIEKEPIYQERIARAIKNGKKPPPEYAKVYSSTLMYLTLGTFLIGLQTSIPSITLRKTYPGCVSSLSGFPMEGEGDDTGLQYIACIAKKIRNSQTIPWNALPNNEETIGTTMRAFIIKYLLPYEEVAQKIGEKIAYIVSNPVLDVPANHSIDLWIQFLPPLRRFHIRNLQPIGSSFLEELDSNIKRGSSKQMERLLVIQSKIIFFSLSIVETIQTIIDKKELLLRSSMHPFMDNACCNDIDGQTLTSLQYFAKENPNIVIENEIVAKLSYYLKDIKMLTEAVTMISTISSKRFFPPLSEQFSEETIYYAFISFCRFQSTIPLTSELAAICLDKPLSLSKMDTIQEKIAKLKREGREYTMDMFLRLLQIVSQNNIVKMSFDQSTPLNTIKLGNLVEQLDIEDSTLIVEVLRENLSYLLDYNSEVFLKDPPEVRRIKNYLDTTNTRIRNNINSFIKRKSSLNKREINGALISLNKLMEWEQDLNPRNVESKISDDTMYNYIQFLKTYTSLCSVVLPEMIIKEQVHVIEPFAYWGFSERHKMDLRKAVDNFYEPLKKFYGKRSLTKVLTEISIECKVMNELANNTPAYSATQIGDKLYHRGFDRVLSSSLFEYYFLQVLYQYIVLAENPNMIYRASIKTRDSRYMEQGEEDQKQNMSSLIEDDVLVLDDEETEFLQGEAMELQKDTANLLVTYLSLLKSSKAAINISYDMVMDRVFKQKETEKYTFTDRLRDLSEEERAVDTILKINKLGVWSKGLSKGVKEYDPEDYDQERDLTEKMAEIEKKIRRTTDVSDRDMDLYIEDELEDRMESDFIDREEYGMGDMNDDYQDGDYYGDEHEDNQDYN